MTLDEFQNIRDTLPTEPGVYRYFDAENTILYVGKAKNIRNRVSQYFVEQRLHSSRIKLMVRQIHRIEFTTVANESDALILENGLIKEYQPKYNIRLKDDKTYPFVVIKKERFPRIYFTRKFIKDGSEYLGPYTSILFAKEIFKTIKSLFALRTCNLNLNADQIQKGKYKVCLEFHIGNCKAPCVGYQSESDYLNSIQAIRDILKGKFGGLKEYMKSEMLRSADQLQFEQAEDWKQKILKLSDFETKSVVFNPKLDNILTVHLYHSEQKKILNYLKISNGTIVATKSFEVEQKLEESDAEIFEWFIVGYLAEHPEIEEVVTPIELTTSIPKVKQTVPQLGDKKQLLELSYRNARSYALSLVTDPKFQKRREDFNILKELQDRLRLTQLPIHIECFDNSNIQGTSPVAACVVFKNGKPSKSDYRHFNVKTVDGPNDFDSMREIVYRRYKRMIDEQIELPQLIIIDGGKGQLSSALESLTRLGLENKIAIVGIAKRLEEIYFKNDPIPLYIDKKSPALKLIQQLRDEAHRFGLSFHRTIRSKKMAVSMLEQVDGLGDKSIQKLYQKYKSIPKMKEAAFDDMVQLIGKPRAENLWQFFNQQLD